MSKRRAKYYSRMCKRLALRYFKGERQEEACAYLEHVGERLALSKKHTVLMLEDHAKALYCLMQREQPLETAMQTLNPSRLGDFYRTERKDWYPLDHAAKLYPLSMGLKRMMIFRESCYLREEVCPEMLQMALNYTMHRFPYFATTIKCGFFWHYVDCAMRRFAVHEESRPPCTVMNLGNIASPSLRVVYWKNRISVEFFHIQTDGYGSSIFLRTLVMTYLTLLGHKAEEGAGLFSLTDEPNPAEWSDDFTMSDPSPKSHGFTDKPAIQLRGMQAYEKPNRVLHYNFSTEKLLSQARAKGVTITTLILGYLMLACLEASGSRFGKRKIQIQLPVNMRKFYPSHTLRNFSMYCSIKLSPDEITGLDDMLPKIAAQVKAGSEKGALDQTMQLSRKLVNVMRFVPLIVKRPLVYLIYGVLSDVVFTTTFSNLGVITVPPGMADAVEKFDFVLGPPVQNRVACAMCSFGDHAVFSVTKNTAITTLEDSLYRLFCENGLEPYVEGTR